MILNCSWCAAAISSWYWCKPNPPNQQTSEARLFTKYVLRFFRAHCRWGLSDTFVQVLTMHVLCSIPKPDNYMFTKRPCWTHNTDKLSGMCVCLCMLCTCSLRFDLSLRFLLLFFLFFFLTHNVYANPQLSALFSNGNGLQSHWVLQKWLQSIHSISL